MNKFYNTINLTDPALSEARKITGRQTKAVLAFFQANPGGRFTALQVKDRVGFHESSVRRACTDLAEAGYLEMLDEKIMERYGKPNHLFRLVNKKGQLGLFQ